MESNRFQPSIQQCINLINHKHSYNINNMDMTNIKVLKALKFGIKKQEIN